MLHMYVLHHVVLYSYMQEKVITESYKELDLIGVDCKPGLHYKLRGFVNYPFRLTVCYE